MLKVLNLYAGVGGNRKLWPNDKIEVTAVEINPSIAAAYKDFYPNDNVIVGDAHQYLLDHYKEFDFIWASPPCQTHSQLRAMRVYAGQSEAIYPDMKLYQEILLLQLYAKCDWVVENVIPFYKPLIQPSFTIQRHHYWINKFILGTYFDPDGIEGAIVNKMEKKLGIDLSKYKFDGIDKRQILRNCVKPELGLYVFEHITGVKS
jgi:DNA (cytosine-5)-methyltransferase 1